MRTPPRGPWPAGLLGTLALVLGVERYVARHDQKFTTDRVAAWRWSGEHVAKAARCRVIVLGDSLVKHGVVPAALEARSGRSAYNLAMPAGLFPAHYFFLRRIIRSGSRPSAVLVDGEAIADEPLGRAARAWPETITLAECAELAWAKRDAAFLGRMALARAFPSLRVRPEARLSLTAALAGTNPDDPFTLPAIWRNWNKNAGAHVLPPFDDSAGDPRVENLERIHYAPSEWGCDPVNASYATRLLDLAAGHGIPVFWLLPPYHPEVEIRRTRGGWWGHYLTYLHDLQRRHPNLTVIDGRHAGYPPEALNDHTHLSRTGAIAYSDALGGVLRDRLAPGAPASAPRWVDLPRYEPARAEALASASAAEDVDQSLREIRRPTAGARPERRLARGRRAAGEGRSR